MDIGNLQEVQMPDQVIGGEAVPAGGMEGGEWRTQLPNDSRLRIVNKIMETLKRHLPFSGQEGLHELKKIAVRFEEKIYTAATSQPDYLRKISLKMLTMETKSQNSMANSLLSNAASSSKSPQDPASLDSSSQIGSAADEDWQEGTYQKIKSMHEMYYPELNEMYQRMSAKLQQIDALPRQPGNESLDKLRFLKLVMERLVKFLQTNKNDIQPNHKDKIGGVEKQIVNILNSNRPRKPVSSMQQGQLTQPPMQQSQQQQPQMHSAESQMNSQMQTSLQHNTLSSGSSVSNSRQNMLDGLQSASNIDPGQSNALDQMQQVAMKSLEQNSVGGSQHMTSSISSPNGMTALQSNVNSLQSNWNILQPQQIKQEQPMFSTQQLKQQYQQRQIEQQYMQRQQLIQQQQQQQQQTSQQQSGQRPGQQLMQLNQMNDTNNIKMQQRLIQQQQLIQQLAQQLQQQQTSQLQPAQLHAQQHMLNQQSLLQQMPSLQQKQQQFQLLKTSLQQSRHLKYMQYLQQKQQQQQLQVQQTYPQQSSQLIGQLQLMPKEQQQQKQQQTSEKQSEQVHGKEQDVEKQLLIPKQQNSRKTASVSLVILALLLLALVMFLCGEVLRTYQLYWE